MGGNDGKERQSASFKKAQEEAGCDQAAEIVANGHECLSKSPSQAEGRHQNPVRHLDDQPGGKRLPTELCHGRDGADKRVLVASKARILAKTKNGAISKHAFVEDLQEVPRTFISV